MGKPYPKNTRYVGYYCPIKLLQAFDEAIKGVYINRTAALCAAMRSEIERLKEQKPQAAVAQEVTR